MQEVAVQKEQPLSGIPCGLELDGADVVFFFRRNHTDGADFEISFHIFYVPSLEFHVQFPLEHGSGISGREIQCVRVETTDGCLARYVGDASPQVEFPFGREGYVRVVDGKLPVEAAILVVGVEDDVVVGISLVV